MEGIHGSKKREEGNEPVDLTNRNPASSFAFGSPACLEINTIAEW
jgi:hypothetical protein